MKDHIKWLGAGLLFMALFSSGEVSAQNYSLHDILEQGLKNSHTMKISASEHSEHHYEVNEAKMAYLPNLSVSGQGALLNNPDIRLMGQPSQMQSPKNAAFVMGSLSIPVFNGFQLSNNLKLKQEMEMAGAQQLSVDSTTVVCNLIDAYVNLYKAQQSKVIIARNLETAKKRVTDFQKMKDNGLLSENDFLKSQLQVSQLEMSMVEVSNKEALAQYNLNLLAGLDPSVQFTADSTVILHTPTLVNRSRGNEVLTERNDYVALEHQLAASEYAMKLQRNSYYPHINLSGMYVSMYVPNTLTVNNMLNLGLSLSYDISALYKNKPAIAIRKEQSYQLSERMSQLEDKINMEVEKGFLDFQTARSKTELYQRIQEQATENYRSVQEKFNNQLSTTNDLLEADLQRVQAEINNRLATADVFLAYCNYLNVTGNLNELKSMN